MDDSGNTQTNEELMKLIEDVKQVQKQQPQVCPHCGRCPTCGRSPRELPYRQRSYWYWGTPTYDHTQQWYVSHDPDPYSRAAWDAING